VLLIVVFGPVLRLETFQESLLMTSRALEDPGVASSAMLVHLETALAMREPKTLDAQH
jgi:hypothetical protein